MVPYAPETEQEECVVVSRRDAGRSWKFRKGPDIGISMKSMPKACQKDLAKAKLKKRWSPSSLSTLHTSKTSLSANVFLSKFAFVCSQSDVSNHAKNLTWCGVVLSQTNS